MAQRISELNDAERAWVDDNVAAARRYVEDAGLPLERARSLDPASLDAAWAFWLQAWPAGEEDPNPVINALGMALGQYLVDRLGLAWKLVEDEYGTEVAIHGQPGDVLILPPNLVAERLHSRTVDCFVSIADEIEQRVAQLQAASAAEATAAVG